MKLFKIKDESDKLSAFEVSNIFLGRKGAIRVIEKIPNVKITNKPKSMSFSNDDKFCEFELEGQKFLIEELFGDNSRYLIGANPPSSTPQIQVIAEYFEKQKMPFGF